MSKMLTSLAVAVATPESPAAARAPSSIQPWGSSCLPWYMPPVVPALDNVALDNLAEQQPVGSPLRAC
jgi:hypothetical protein